MNPLPLLLVDEHDTIIGTEEKLKTHELWLLHRAFSVYVFDRSGRMLIQQRAMSKYHAPWLRANTCCSHQFPDESNEDAAHRRLREEMGFDCSLTKVTEFIYQVPVPPNLIEHEYLHVFVGLYEDQEIKLNPEEVMAYQRIAVDDLMTMIEQDDPILAPWTKITWTRAGNIIRDKIIID